jgi:hypothetical protein
LLKKLLTVSKEVVKREVCSKADLKGQHCWLWLPKAGANERVCLVAHIDTVWDRRQPRRKKVFFDPVHGVYWSPDGLGADDRAGVFAALSLRSVTGCMVLLTDLEETGGVGATEAAEVFKDLLEQVDFFIEIDRKNSKEAVFYNGESKEFRSYICSFGFKESYGTFSDISILGEKLGKCSVNLSAGYYNPHQLTEYLVERELYKTIERVEKILTAPRGSYDVKKFKITTRPVVKGYDDWWKSYFFRGEKWEREVNKIYPLSRKY